MVTTCYITDNTNYISSNNNCNADSTSYITNSTNNTTYIRIFYISDCL